MLRIGLLILCSYVSSFFNVYAFGCPPEKGWVGVTRLSVIHEKEQYHFDLIHNKLAQVEESLTRVLPHDDKTNTVFASITFIGQIGDSKGIHFCPLKNNNDQWLVFESSWTSPFAENPVLQKAQKKMKNYAKDLQRDDLSEAAQHDLLADCVEIVAANQHYTDIVETYSFFPDTDIYIPEVLERANRVLSQIPLGSPATPLTEALERDQAAVYRIFSGLDEEKNSASQAVTQLSAVIAEQGITMDLADDLEKLTKNIKKSLAKHEREVNNISNKVMATYWHSEQRFLKYLEDYGDTIIEGLELPFEQPERVILHLHSRHDICPVCSHTLIHSYTHPEGTLTRFGKIIREKYELKNLPFHLTTSFRELRTDVEFGLPVEVEDFQSLLPAFPTKHIPLGINAEEGVGVQVNE